MEHEVSFKELPPEISRKLRQSANRIRRIIFLRGLMATLATGLIALLTIMGIDAAVVIYSSLLRWCFTLCGLGCVGLCAWLLLVKPMARRFTPAQLAALIEARHPELEERISTVVELLSMPETRERGSQQLVEVLKESAELDIKGVSPRREFTGRTIRAKLALALGAFFILALLIAIWPRHVGRLLVRAVVPSAEVSNVYSDNVTVSPEDAMVLTGEPLEITLKVVDGFPGQANLLREVVVDGGKRETTERMRQVDGEEGAARGDRVYRLLVPSVEQSFRYRVACGHALTRHYRISAIPRPAITNFHVECHYPEYVARAPKVFDAPVLAETSVPVGGFLRLRTEFNKDQIRSAMTRSNQQEVVYGKSAAGVRVWEIAAEKDMASVLTFHLKDGYGFTNLPVQVSVKSVPDRAPEISLLNPGENSIKLPPDGRINFAFTVTDDYGVHPPVVMAGADGGEMQACATVELTPTNGEDGQWQGAVSIALARISGTARTYRFQILTEDYLPAELGGPNRAASPLVTVQVDREALSFERQIIAERADALDRQLADVIEHLEQADKKADALEKRTQSGQPLSSDEERQLNQLREEITQAGEAVKRLSEDVKDTAFDQMAKPLKRLEEQQIDPARIAADEASVEKNPKERAALLAETERKLESALDAAKQSRERVAEMAKQLDELAKLEDLAASQADLAERASELDSADDLKQWSQQQEALEHQTEQAYLDDLAAQKEAFEDAAKAFSEMKETAEQLAERQERLRQSDDLSTADQQRQQEGIAQEAQQLANRAQEQSNQMQNQGDSHSGERVEAASQEAQKAAEQMKGGEDASGAQKQAQSDFQMAAQQFEKDRRSAAQAAQSIQQQIDEQKSGNSHSSDKQEGASQSDQQEGPPQTSEESAQQSSNQNAGNQKPSGEMKTAVDAMQKAQQKAQQLMRNGQDGLSSEQKQSLQNAAQQAAQQMKQSARQMAQEKGLPLPSQMKSDKPQSGRDSTGMPGQPRNQSDEEGGVPAALQGRVSAEDWFRFKGDAKSGALEDALRQVPAEYRELVKRYFQSLSEGK